MKKLLPVLFFGIIFVVVINLVTPPKDLSSASIWQLGLFFIPLFLFLFFLFNLIFKKIFKKRPKKIAQAKIPKLSSLQRK
ncbi:MAG: hypothetical protein Q7R43_05335 [Candidatus Daviesbacteria bacterium]|nr:hypothetical protein [Candidatus Daviesbacteria bacterium]